MQRREILRLLAAGAGLGTLDGLAPDDLVAIGRRLHARARDGAPRGGALGSHQRETVTVAAEHIIPESDTPGATDAGVTRFIEHMLAEWYEPAERDRVLAGLVDLDARSRALGAPDFVGLPGTDRVALLSAIDAEAADSDHWFSMLKFLTVWGYCTSEVAMRQALGAYPPPWRYDPCAPYTPRAGGR